LFNIVQVWLTISGLLAIYLVSKKSKWGPIWGLIGQPAWFYSAIYTKQCGMFVSSIAYSVMWSLAAFKWWRNPEHAINQNKIS
jgi:hypothetical protein